MLGVVSHAISDALLEALKVLMEVALLFQHHHIDFFVTI